MKKIWDLLMRFCRFCLQGGASIFHIQITDEKWQSWEQFIKFIFVGCSNALITLLVNNIIILVWGEKFYILGQTVGYIAGIINSYILNSRLVFQKKSTNKSTSFIKMCICYLSTYFLQIGLLYLFVSVLNWSVFLSPIIAIIITTPINFIINKLWAFKEKQDNS